LNLIADFRVPRRWIRWAAAKAEGLVAVSSGLRDRLAALGARPDRVRVLRNGVDLAQFRPGDRAAARRGLGLTRPTLLAVGNLVALKRHKLMVEALALLPETDLVIVGDGPQRGAIEALARQRGIPDRVRLLGRLPQERLAQIYQAADLLLLVSTHEGWPNVLLESMACGTPVVVSEIAGIADIVATPAAGLVVAAVTAQRLAAAISDLLAGPPTRAATRAYAEQFDWQATTDGQIALFREICEEHAQAGPTPVAAHCRSTRA
ncbi:MAG: glycosyltransferase, partial [Stellaceae bacterium]